MQITAQRTAPSSAGLLLLDSRLNPILVSRVAAQILCYPHDPEMVKDIDRFFARKVHSTLVSKESLNELAFHREIQSGRRSYLCRTFQESSVTKQHGPSVIVVLLERDPATSLRQISEKFRLTMREREVLEFLSQGLTSKEIAVRMKISPNTVKAFLRLIMIKMGVSTRSGIVGKVMTTRP